MARVRNRPINLTMMWGYKVHPLNSISLNQKFFTSHVKSRIPPEKKEKGYAMNTEKAYQISIRRLKAADTESKKASCKVGPFSSKPSIWNDYEWKRISFRCWGVRMCCWLFRHQGDTSKCGLSKWKVFLKIFFCHKWNEGSSISKTF